MSSKFMNYKLNKVCLKQGVTNILGHYVYRTGIVAVQVTVCTVLAFYQAAYWMLVIIAANGSSI